MGTDIQFNPIRHGADVVTTFVDGTCSTAGEMLDGAIEFAGDTVGQIRSLFPSFTGSSEGQSPTQVRLSGNGGNNPSAGADVSLRTGQGGNSGAQNGWERLTNALSGTFSGVRQVTDALGGGLQNMSGQLMWASYYMQPTDAMRMYYNSCGGFGCGSRYYALDMMSYMPYMYNPMPLYYPPNPSGCGCQSGCGSGGYNPYDAFLPPIDTARQALDRVLHPERYNTGDNGDNANNPDSQDSSQNPLPSSTNISPWAQAIQDKIDRKQPVTANEQGLITAYKKLHGEYSPYRLDENGIVSVDGNGKPQKSPLGEEILIIQNLLEDKNPDAVMARLQQMPLEKRAAIEAHYKEITGGKNLREEIKESCLWTGFGWTNWNTDKSQRMLDMLDQAAMVNPRNMAAALRQAINDHRMFGWGIDDDRVAKLLAMMRNNPEFKAAVDYEYQQETGSMLSTDIGDKWFISSENSWIKSNL